MKSTQRFMRGKNQWMTLEQAQEFDRKARGEEKEEVRVKVKMAKKILENAPELPTNAPAQFIPADAEVKVTEAPCVEEAPIKEGLTDLGAILILKKTCDAKGIKYHHASGIKKLKELLAESEKE